MSGSLRGQQSGRAIVSSLFVFECASQSCPASQMAVFLSCWRQCHHSVRCFCSLLFILVLSVVTLPVMSPVSSSVVAQHLSDDNGINWKAGSLEGERREGMIKQSG